MQAGLEKLQGRREHKRSETLGRIAETGLRLFVENGYEATTLDAIAEAAGISRRTFFYYFKSKEDVLLGWQNDGVLEALRPTLLGELSQRSPLSAARECFLKLASRYETKESVIVDRMLRSTPALRARKEAEFVTMERALVEVLWEMWPAAHRDALRMDAMMAMGTLRLALDEWRQGNAKHSLQHYLRQSFALLDKRIRDA